MTIWYYDIVNKFKEYKFECLALVKTNEEVG